MAGSTPTFADRRRLLQLETLYDLAIRLYAERQEQELLDELLERVCAVLDPAVAVAVTREPSGGGRALAVVGWPGPRPSGAELLDSRGSTMTRQTADHLRDEIVEFEHRHRSEHQAGAPADR